IYLASANTAQKPQAVLDTLEDFYRQHNANVARAVHTLGEEATSAYEAVRAKIAALINVPDPQQMVYTRGTTEAINLVARSYLRPLLQAGDEILVTEMEHHANIVPWQLVAAEVGAKVVAAPVNDDGSLDLAGLAERIGPRTKLVGVVHVSNVLGTINPIKQIAKLTRAAGVPLLVDGSQALPHIAVDVSDLGCDFYCFTGHKLYGPTGTGA
ncbi:MAG: aminotransferase class V-fold PLP-dependent enzyme, partial [Anaerolineae bacterium]|nr:aminotransferase class V-fold PLP-dependent enzyme [Anaerolineae bacterium]